MTRGDKPELPIESLPLLNEKIWGLPKRALTVIGARTSNGKSAFSTQLAYDLARQKKRVLFLSLEMTVIDMAIRIFAHNQHINNEELLKGKFDEYKDKWEDFYCEFQDLPLVIADKIGHNFDELNAYIRSLKSRPDVVIVDYIQNIKKQKRDFKEDIDGYLKDFRETAIRHDFAGIVLSQVNRASQANQEKEPKLHHLKATGYLEEHADLVMLLHWPKLYEEANPNEFKIFIEKNRNGRTGFHQVWFYPEYYQFCEKADTNENKELADELNRLAQT
jgi:replicative DNA helicase